MENVGIIQRPSTSPRLVDHAMRGDVSLMVIEENRLLRDGIEAMLAHVPECSVHAASGGGREVVDRLSRLCPDVVLVDVALAARDEHALCERIRTAAPAARLVVMGIGTAQDDLAAFIRAGTAGFIMKDATPQEFLATIRLVAAGEPALPRALTQTLFTDIERTDAPVPHPRGDGERALTARECEVADLIVAGMSNKRIAARLRISVHTVKSHVHNILDKLGLETRVQVAVQLPAADAAAERPPSIGTR